MVNFITMVFIASVNETILCVALRVEFSRGYRLKRIREYVKNRKKHRIIDHTDGMCVVLLCRKKYMGAHAFKIVTRQNIRALGLVQLRSL